MEESQKRLIGEELEPGGRPKAPGRLELLQRFINTHNHDFPPDWDRIGTAAKATRWLVAKALIAPGDAITKADAARLRALREAIRALLVDAPAGRLPRAVGAAPSSTSWSTRRGGPRSRPPMPASTARWPRSSASCTRRRSAATGARMKACRQCEYAFFDRSKNRSAAWCSMSICGNRTKNRAYYQRKRS